ncbi:non-specific lipid-transfer protein 2P [Salvia divinorum]|uniref:Non-specific lipid-transfer protein 2P n=1 Tax=Salvia divinorum TaxID=28513 RepID=A0ABD1IDX6_SALDI
MKKGVAALFVVVVMAVLVHETKALTPPPPPPPCDPTKIESCTFPILFGTSPSAECCRKLKEQEHCFCQFIKDPQFSQFLQSPNAAKLARACNVTIPTNC